MCKSRNRGDRRDLTDRYQTRQLRIRRSFGEYYCIFDELTPAGKGRLRRHSFADCGQPSCCFCVCHLGIINGQVILKS